MALGRADTLAQRAAVCRFFGWNDTGAPCPAGRGGKRQNRGFRQKAAPMPARKLFVTTALPYANGNFHIGHIMEYIQADICARQRLLGNEVNFVGADDTHGAPIMIAAEKAGKTPQQFVADIAAGRQQYLDGFTSSSTTGTAPTPREPRARAAVYLDLKANGLIETRTIEQFFDPRRTCSCPTASSGRMPQVPRQGPVRRQLRGLRRRVCAHRPHQPLFGPLGRQAGAQALGTFSSSSCRTRAAWPSWKTGRRTAACSPRWPTRCANGSPCAPTPTARRARAWATGTSRATRPTSASRSPMRRASTSMCGWTRPSAASLKNLLDKRGQDYEDLHGRPAARAVPLHRQDIVTFTRCSGPLR